MKGHLQALDIDSRANVAEGRGTACLREEEAVILGDPARFPAPDLAYHDDPSITFRAYCAKQERHAMAGAAVLVRDPRLAAEVEYLKLLLRVNGLIDWENDPAGLIVRKVMKRLGSCWAILRTLAVFTALCGALPLPRLRAPFYKIVGSLHIFRGFRSGLAKYRGQSVLGAPPAISSSLRETLVALLLRVQVSVRVRSTFLLTFLLSPVWRLNHALSQQQAIPRGTRGRGFVSCIQQSRTRADSGVKVIAFYLPQFHPIPENNEWWGEGFTEWANVVEARPQFVGHYQPRLPLALGFYDLRLIDVQRQQAKLAKRYGIHGFMYYYYWFQGRRLLERPLQQMLATPDIDLPFCVCWANENWTRGWDGQENEVLLAQTYSPGDDFEFIDALLPIFKDPRYIRVDGRPLLVVYRSDKLPEPAATIARWTQRCIARGEKPPYVLRTNAGQRGAVEDPAGLGFCGTMEFPPHGITSGNVTKEMRIINPHYRGNIYDYSTVVKHELRKKAPAHYDYYRCVFPSWDNESRRRGRDSKTFAGSSPALYGLWLRHACEHAMNTLRSDRRFVFVNAWNEWAEGAYLEPDCRYGYAYLQMTNDILAGFKHQAETSFADGAEARCIKPCAVILHLHDPESWKEMLSLIRGIPIPVDLYVSVPRSAYPHVGMVIKAECEGAAVTCHDDCGEDTAAFLRLYARAYRYQYKYICRVRSHSRRGAVEAGRHRRSVASLLGSPERIVRILKGFDDNLRIGIVAAEGFISVAAGSRHGRSADGGFDRLSGLLADLGIEYAGQPLRFVAGGEFWFRPEALAGLLRRAWRDEEFQMKSLSNGDSPTHIMEKVFGVVAGWSGFEVVMSSDVRRSSRSPFLLR